MFSNNCLLLRHILLARPNIKNQYKRLSADPVAVRHSRGNLSYGDTGTPVYILYILLILRYSICHVWLPEILYMSRLTTRDTIFFSIFHDLIPRILILVVIVQ